MRSWARRIVLLGPFFLAMGACERPQYTYADDVPINNSMGASTSFGFGGSFSTAGSVISGGSVALDPCAFDRVDNGQPIFTAQALSNQQPARAEVYAELTDEEVIALEAGGSLIPPQPQPQPQPPVTSPLTSVLMQLLNATTELNRPLVQQLLARFKNTRATWPNPWALRLVDHPGSEHMNPVRIAFKKDAWIARLVGGSPEVVDLDNAVVSIDAATAEPGRIAAIYYIVDGRTAGFGTAQCETGKRELALGNEAMVESFTIGSAEILARLNSDIDALNGLFKVARKCSTFDKGPQTFQAYTVCTTWSFFDASTEYSAYQWSLGTPVEQYKPTPQNLANLIQALQDDRFEPAPFVGVPPQSMGAGGAGGEGGASAAGAGGDPGFPQGGI
jgi:hypothetical protein